MQKTGKVKLPQGKKVAVNFGFDFDAMSVWIGTFGLTSPVYLSRGEYGAEVGTPRILEVLKEYNIQSSWFIPGHTADTFPEACKKVIEAGHEIGAHGYLHKNITQLTYDEEVEEMTKGLASLKKLGAPAPVTYRSPAWDFSPSTLKILADNGIKHDSSLMGNDVYPYFPRSVTLTDNGAVFGETGSVMEFSPSWYLDDFPTQEYVIGGAEGMNWVEGVFQRWESYFDYALTQEGAIYVNTFHPQVIGRPHMLQRFVKMVEYMAGKGAWFAPIAEIAKATQF